MAELSITTVECRTHDLARQLPKAFARLLHDAFANLCACSVIPLNGYGDYGIH